MDYGTLIKQLVNFDDIIVAGPQRSGTTFLSQAIAASLDYKHYDEMEFKAHDEAGFFRVLGLQGKKVIQAPGMCHILHMIPDKEKGIVIVWIDRPNELINKSEDRIGWHPKEFETEREKYKRYKYLDFIAYKATRNAPMKKQYWHFQKQLMQIYFIEAPFYIIEQAPGYKPPDERKNLKPKQTK